jgi:hypothetical protein
MPRLHNRRRRPRPGRILLTGRHRAAPGHPDGRGGSPRGVRGHRGSFHRARGDSVRGRGRGSVVGCVQGGGVRGQGAVLEDGRGVCDGGQGG